MINGTELPKCKPEYDVFDNNILGKSFFDKTYFRRHCNEEDIV